MRHPRPFGSAGYVFHQHVEVDPGEALELLGDDRGLEVALGGKVGVLPVAATATGRTGVRTGRGDPAGSGLEHLDRVRPQELRGRPGDDGPHPLTRQRVPDEDDSALVPGHAVTPVRHSTDLEDEDVAGRVRRLAHALGALGAGGLVGWAASGEACEDISCHGTLATMTPGVKSSRPLRRSADWLCSSCSHQCPTTYSGM